MSYMLIGQLLLVYLINKKITITRIITYTKY